MLGLDTHFTVDEEEFVVDVKVLDLFFGLGLG
jgi:hypothetical protein